MNLALIIASAVLAFLIYKLFDCINRNSLSKLETIKFGFSAGLLLIFVVTSKLYDFPESLYWFVFFSMLLSGAILSLRVVRQEIKRFMDLKREQKILNLLLYPLMLIALAIII